MSFWGELKRRNVYKVGVAYAIVAWLLIQAAAIISPALQLPSWMLPVVIILLCIGFPIAILLAWAYEVTPEGIKRTKQVPLAESITHLTGQKLNYIVTGLLVLAVGFLAVKVFFLDRRVAEPEKVSTETEQAPSVVNVEKAKKTIAVLPFENLSSDPEQVYFVDGLSEEILNSLCQIPDLNVSGRTSSFSFKDSNKTIQEIADVLGVENILEGSVRKASNSLRITAQLLRASDGFHLWSKTYDRELKDVFAVQEDIATAVANELKITLGIGKSIKQLGGTDNLEAYELYLVAKGQAWASNDLSILNRAMESIDKAIALDPEFALAWALKGRAHNWLSIFGSTKDAATEQDAALHAALKAIELEPNLAIAYYALGDAKMSLGDWINAELAYRKALELTSGPVSESGAQISIFYISVGNFEKSYEILEQRRRNDPMNKDVRGNYLLILGIRGDMQEAEEEYRRCGVLFGEQEKNVLDGPITFIRLGSGHIASSNQIVYSHPLWDTIKQNLESPEEELKELRRFFTNEDLSASDLQDISTWAAYFGEPEFAMDAMEKAVSIEASNIFCAWFPVMREVRQTPRFKKFVKKIGLVDYWNQFGWPDICHQLDNGDFECD